MVERIETFVVTIPSAYTTTGITVQSLNFPEGIVRRVEIVYPDGCAGLVGARLTYGGGTLAPRTTGAFVRRNDDTATWDLNKVPTGSQWKLEGVNSDAFDHSLTVLLYVDEFGTDDPTGSVLPPVIGDDVGGGAPTEGLDVLFPAAAGSPPGFEDTAD